MSEAESLRPRGTVEVRCGHPGCGWCWWVEPLHPKLPDGPWDCGEDHAASQRVRVALSTLRIQTGIHWGSMSGKGPERPNPDGTCGSGRSYSAGVVGLYDRYRDKQGVFEWENVSELEDLDALQKRIQWGLAIGIGVTDIGPVPLHPMHKVEPGKVMTVGYQWRDREIRKYTFVKCARPGCAQNVMVDYDRPSMKCGIGDTYSVGAWGGDDLPEPPWWNNREFQCEDGLSADYKCRLFYGCDALREFEEKSGVRWTMWTHHRPLGTVLFYDPVMKIHGYLPYADYGDANLPVEFWSVESIGKAISWGNIRTLHANLGTFRPNDDIFYELYNHVPR